MENYIVRIYRRDHRNSKKITGLVESVEADVKKAFTDFDQLREILAAGRRWKVQGTVASKKSRKAGWES